MRKSYLSPGLHTRFRAALLFFAALGFASNVHALSPEDAADHVGKQAEICGVVASAKFAAGSCGKPTFLNLGRPYPNHIFTAVIWGSHRERFDYAPEDLEGEGVCVSGTISTYRGKPQIEVSSPSQIQR